MLAEDWQAMPRPPRQDHLIFHIMIRFQTLLMQHITLVGGQPILVSPIWKVFLVDHLTLARLRKLLPQAH